MLELPPGSIYILRFFAWLAKLYIRFFPKAAAELLQTSPESFEAGFVRAQLQRAEDAPSASSDENQSDNPARRL